MTKKIENEFAIRRIKHKSRHSNECTGGENHTNDNIQQKYIIMNKMSVVYIIGVIYHGFEREWG